MEYLLFTKLPNIVQGRTVSFYKETQISTILIDSRKLGQVSTTLFFAIKGKQHNGHQYIKELYRKGVRNFIVEEPTILKELPEANILLVNNSIIALQELAAYHRSQFQIPVIGITGSNGKTITKEWLYQLLSPDYSIVKNPGSYNSQVGVPLSIWNIESQHNLGIFEAGISSVGEMSRLKKIIQPTIGIFTNIGTAHDEGFINRYEKIREKLRLFEDVSLLIYCKDHTEVDSEVLALSIQKLSWGFSSKADIQIFINDNETSITSAYGNLVLNLPFSDHASLENCFHCIALMLYFKIPTEIIQQRINNIRPVPMRLELKDGINQCYVIDDSYNNDLAGLQISLDFLMHQKQKGKKRVILSSILQSGLPDGEMAESVAKLVNSYQIDSIVAIGYNLENHINLFEIPTQFYKTTEAYINTHDYESYDNEVILIKGARSFGFERIVKLLQRKVHGTVMEIDLGALTHNLNFFRSKLKTETKLMVMVKAFAYGSGSIEVANILNYHQVDYLGVAYSDEGIELRKNNIQTPIMVMNPTADSFQSLVTYSLEPEIYSFRILQEMIDYLDRSAMTIHIKLDTGMHRLGFESDQLPDLIALIKENKNLKIASIFSHLAASDEVEHDGFSVKQAEIFKDMADLISQAIGYKPMYHILNTPGILRFPEFQFDMVRLGVGLYGVDPTTLGSQLKTVATLKTIISQIKLIEKGQTIGYGRKGIANRKTRIATIAIGYADGFSRAFSQQVGCVYVNGTTAPVIGNVCMDMTMIDVTDVNAREGDEVIIFGSELPINELAKRINTIPYEILTNTSERVKRIFVAESI